MPSLSTTVTKVLDICNRPSTSPNDLNQVISLDPVLTGQVLRLINSAYYSLLHRATSLTRAIILLGVNTVKNLALSTAILNSLSGKKSFRALSVNDFWTHSICVGVTARSIAARKGVSLAEQGEYFVAGLLHDLGKIPLNNRFPKDYLGALELAKNRKIPLNQAETIVFGVDHGTVGEMIAQKWQLSPNIYDCLCHHHNPGKTRPENRRLVEIVALANVYANFMRVGSSGNCFPEQSMLDDLLDRVGIEWSALTDFHESSLKEIERGKAFLQMIRKRKIS
ncbi:MAG TPA: HDOD domain-containing protein [Desulfobacterales bacterium]|nr:HDOD domain-containing protein [Desulfobacterales bacterium]